MPKLTLIYDPENGDCVPDGKVISKAEELINSGGTYTFGNDMFFTAFRTLVKRGKIQPKDVEILFKHYGITLNSKGTCDFWPEGFCDYGDEMLAQLIDWDK